MKYQKAMKKKLSRIAAAVQREVEIGKCDQEDIEHIAKHILMTVTPFNDQVEEISLKEKLQLRWSELGLVDDKPKVMTPSQIDAEIEMQILRMKEDPF